MKKTLKNMSLEQKIGQLFQVAAFSNRDKKHEEEILTLIEKYHLGGLTFFQGEPLKQVELTNKYQSKSSVPLFINIDAEWGLAMRLQGTTQFPYQMALGAIKDDTLILKMAHKIGEHCKRIGVCSPLAPVVDVNNNPKNPVINYRSFGEDKIKVANKGIAYMKGLQSAHVLDNAKHFPGHGDTATDSHLDLPRLTHSSERLNAIELYPFKELIKNGLSSIMTAHLEIPVWDNRENMPTTLSNKILSSILFDQLNFKGLAITDAMDMQGITKYYADGDADVMAILAGNHIITNSRSVPKGVEKIKQALLNGELSEKQLDVIVTNLLAMKKWVGLDQAKRISTENLSTDLNDEESKQLNKVLAEASITYLGKAPLQPLNKDKTIYLKLVGEQQTKSTREQVAHHLKEIKKEETNTLLSGLNALEVTTLTWNESEGEASLKKILEKAQGYERVILSIHGINIKPFNHFDLPEIIRKQVLDILSKNQTTVLFFGNAYGLDEIENIENAKEVIVTYQDSEFMQEAVLRVLKGELNCIGELPVSLKKLS
ncbi:glycoside hydrolase family 3 protein [Flammeovirga pectinis]|uniref:glycoside hydrolase family 3 protein n=1 Tax=Flammeovirga pectinis TaxID=2494373 RepID=UPI001476AD6F|nr:glycoside hydrolase family 3 N-terminal domain-containing protein [Flammeovirga pectinis]